MLQSNINNTLGSAYIGSVLASILFGLTTLQTYIFYTRSTNDTALLKTSIAALWTLDGLHLAMIVHAVYTFAVTRHDDPNALVGPTWSIIGTVLATGLSDGIIRCVFCYRIWVLSKGNRVLVATFIFIATVVFGFSIGYSVIGFRCKTFVELDRTLSWVLWVGTVGAFVADLLLSATLCVLLARSRSAFKSTQSVIRKLMLYTINTGGLTTLCSACTLIVYSAARHTTLLPFLFWFVLPKLFLNALLATLNGREALRHRLAANVDTRFSFSSFLRGVPGESTIIVAGEIQAQTGLEAAEQTTEKSQATAQFDGNVRNSPTVA